VKDNNMNKINKLAILAALTFAPLSFAAEVAKPVSQPALTVKVTALQTRQLVKTLTASGTVQAWQEAVVSAEIAGLRIATVNVGLGDYVQRGDVLATLAAETLQASEAEARAALLESEAILADAKANSERSRRLSASGFVTDQQANQTLTSEQTAAARVEVQRARLQSAQLRLAQCKIIASDAGVISVANAVEGSLSQQGAELFRLIRQGQLEWRAELTADELPSVKKGMSAEIVLANGRMLKGKVRAVAPMVNAQTRYGYVLVKLPRDAELRAGAFVRGVFVLGGGQKSLPTLPQSAILQRGSQTYVLVVGADFHVHERPVAIGLRNGDRVEIKSGLSSSEQVIETGGSFLTEGDVVQVVKG
jgi:RND family efflux transporter MFP subunit